MKRNSLMNSPCERAAERVQFWFARGRNELLSDVKREQHSNEWSQHKCDLVKLPRVQSQINSLALYGYEMSKEMKRHCSHASKKYIVTKEIIKRGAERGGERETLLQSQAMHTDQCCASQKTASFQFEELCFTKNELSSERVMRFRVKEHVLAARRLKSFSKQAKGSQTKKHEIIPLLENSQPASQDPNEFWETYLKSKEQPLFEIGKITKF